MKFLDRRFLPLVLFGLVYFLIMVLINLYIQGQVGPPLVKTTNISVVPKTRQPASGPQQAGEKNKKGLLPDDPSKYNILEYKDYHLPQTQPQWDYFMNETLIDSRVLTHLDSQDFFRGLQKSPQEYMRQMDRVSSLIGTLEENMRKSPSGEVRDRLQNLYMLRSTLEKLKDSVVKERTSAPIK